MTVRPGAKRAFLRHPWCKHLRRPVLACLVPGLSSSQGQWLEAAVLAQAGRGGPEDNAHWEAIDIATLVTVPRRNNDRSHHRDDDGEDSS